jgi:hypothetical protein
MTDDEFDALFEAACQQALNDPEADGDIDRTKIALQIHGHLLKTYCLELDVRGGVTSPDIKRIEAIRHALCCYNLLHVSKLYEQLLMLLTAMKTSELFEEELKDRVRDLTVLHKHLISLDEIEPLARKTLAGLGLPATIEEFEDYRNRRRIKLNMDVCTLASDRVFDKLQTALAAAKIP